MIFFLPVLMIFFRKRDRSPRMSTGDVCKGSSLGLCQKSIHSEVKLKATLLYLCIFQHKYPSSRSPTSNHLVTIVIYSKEQTNKKESCMTRFVEFGRAAPRLAWFLPKVRVKFNSGQLEGWCVRHCNISASGWERNKSTEQNTLQTGSRSVARACRCPFLSLSPMRFPFNTEQRALHTL